MKYLFYPAIQSGDIIFQTTNSSQCKAVQLATHSRYSHVGIIFEKNDDLYVYEAVQPVRITGLDEWIEHGVDEHYVIKRLKNAKEVLTPEIITEMQAIGETHLGKNYDLAFAWSDERIYCSELVWKIYNQATGIIIGNLQKLKEFDLSSPIVQAKLKERYGEYIPYEEEVISPAAMFESDLLITIEEG